MSSYLCINCWRVTAEEDLRFHCRRCSEERAEWPFWMLDGEAGEKSLKGVPRRGWLDRLFGSARRNGYCRIHPDQETPLYCECDLALEPSARLPEGRKPGIGFAGPMNAGKTMLLMAMLHELDGVEVGGHEIHLSGIAETEKRFGNASSSFFDGVRAGATQEPEHAAPLAGAPEESRATSTFGAHGEVRSRESYGWKISLQRRGKTWANSFLGVLDMAGETWSRPWSESSELVDRYVESLSSVVFVVDGALVAQDVELPVNDAWDRHPERRGGSAGVDRQLLSDLLARLGNRGPRVDLALVVSKADILWQHEPWEALGETDSLEVVLSDERQELLRDLLRSSGRSSLYGVARDRLRNVKIFAASSLGFCPSEEDVLSRDRLSRPPEPRGVVHPLAWLFRKRWPRLARG